MTTKDTMESSNSSLYSDNTLSDINIKFNGRRIWAHKAILAQKSAYFQTEFSSLLPVTTSEEVDLGDEDDPEAVHAMLRHIYDSPYAQQVTGTTGSSEESLIFCLNVFIVADKYDVIGLRQKVVHDFRILLQRAWNSEAFVVCMKKLYGPDAMHLADSSLQTAIADFFVDNMSKITHHKSLVTMIEEDKSFAGRILAGLLKTASGSTRYLGVCHKPDRSNRTVPDCTYVREGEKSYLAAALNEYCVHCGTAAGTAYSKSGGGTAECQIRHTVKVMLL